MTFMVLAAGLVSGIFVRSLFYSQWEYAAFVLLIGVVSIFFTKERARLVAIFLIAAGLGALRFGVADTALPEGFANDLNKNIAYQGVVVADPDLRDASQRVTIKVNPPAGGGEVTKILAVADRYPSVSVGESVEVKGKLALPEPFASENGRTFAYDKFLQKDGIRFLVQNASLTATAAAPWYSLPHFFAIIKHSFLDGLRATLPEPYASLAGGVVIGGKSGLGKDLQESFVLAGLVQVIVLSGYNVMVVAEWVMFLLGYLQARRGLSAAAGVLALILFVAIAGASATAIRAGLMAIIALYARATGRTYEAGRALVVVASLMLLWNPFLLVFDPGFDLSVVATAGLIWLAPILELRMARITNAWLRNMIATTLAAQIAVLPLLLYQTGNLSLVAVPANLIVTPIVPFVMGFAALAGVAGIVFGSFAWPIALPTYLGTWFIIEVAKVSAALPFAVFQIPAFPFIFVLLMYAVLVYAVVRRLATTSQLRFSKNAST